MASSSLEAPLASIDSLLPTESSEPSTPTYVPAGKILAALAALALGFVVAATVIHLSIRRPLRLYAEIRSEKLAILNQWAGRATSAAFGSSHIDMGFDPRAFDNELDGTTTSLNLGISGGSQTEQTVMAKTFLDSLPAAVPGSQSRFLLLEITAGANFTNDHLFHPRAINIYDLPTADLATEFAGWHKLSARRAVGRSVFAWTAGLLHYTNVGMLSSVVFPAPLNPALVAAQTGNDRRGLTYNPPADPKSPEAAADRKILASTAVPRQVPGEVLDGHLQELHDLATEAKAKNAQLVYFVAPRLDNLITYPIFPDYLSTPSGPVAILNVGRPDLHPELYRSEFWHDPAHMTEAGAQVFSRLLAAELKKKLHLPETTPVTQN